jgi:hypothetical protein
MSENVGNIITIISVNNIADFGYSYPGDTGVNMVMFEIQACRATYEYAIHSEIIH